jgi:cobalt/nickel transport system ATP-binding protein
MKDNGAIHVEDAYFSYPDGHAALKGVSCHLQYGEKVALIGPNGAGKSTFMSMLNGVALPDSGRVVVAGLEVRKENLNQVRRKVGIVFQDPDDQLFCPTVFDDVAFGPLNLGLPSDEIRARVTEALSLVGLTGFEQRASFHLSFGERKRLALAAVLSYQPDILVFDEPSTNMDPLNRRRLINWLHSSDKTILLCTHDLDIVLEVCSRCLVLVNGRIVADGPARDILYDRALLEKNNLELPLALMTYELLHEKLRTGQMDEEHRRVIGQFLHVHRHAHDPDQHEHVHLHIHAHDHDHIQEHVHSEHIHDHEEGDEHTHYHDDGTHHHHGPSEVSAHIPEIKIKPLSERPVDSRVAGSGKFKD